MECLAPITKNIMIDFKQIDNIEIEGIDYKDHPDYCDAFVARCHYKWREATEEELDLINQDSDFVHEATIKYLT